MSAQHSPAFTGLCLALTVGLLAACGRSGPAPASSLAPEKERATATSVSNISADEIKEQRATRIEEVLQSRASGVQVFRLANGDLSVRIRGSSSIMGSTEPLFVIDGVPQSQRGASAALRGLNPHDVATIQVLKDAGAASFYGARGGNGVILITTKRAP
jgi:TonB-dependent starch-binding outer membrane protein SusC